MGPWAQRRRLPFGYPGEQERTSKRSETIQPAYRSVSMSPLWVFGISIAFSLFAWGIVVVRHWWPDLRRLPRADALRPLLLLHAFRRFVVLGAQRGFARSAGCMGTSCRLRRSHCCGTRTVGARGTREQAGTPNGLAV